MTPENFALWLQGYVELNGTTPTTQQWQIIKDHLKEVFDKRTPNRDNGVQQGPVTDQLARPPEFRMPTIGWNGTRQPGGIGPIIC
ncbi:hypothetical protein KoPa4_00067 [Pseudomonas phage vB_PpuM-KoPa-4]|uniref:Uncharacterized protein n=1 Tax=Pseudomonas phage vB_PpuM-KoPa-4 TaxID=3132618 RepID=A0AAX4MWX7_9CAUD